jgi:preprotein translocase subunit SecG
MWAIVIGLLTVIMVLDCVVLIFLVLIQLPKKEAGAGLAFGAGATDALFGAGSGTVLTKITKYAATTFFVLAILLSILKTNQSGRSTSEFERKLAQPGKAPATMPGTSQSGNPGVVPPSQPTPPSTATSNANPLLSIPAEATNAPPLLTTPSNTVPSGTPK